MRLIDADALMEELHHMIEDDIEVKEDYEYLGIDDCIRSQLTAYDVEKVVEQINDYPHGYLNVEVAADLTEIIRKGEVNERD